MTPAGKSRAKSGKSKTVARKKPAKRGREKSVPSDQANSARETDRRIFSFGDGRADGNSDLRELLGGKGANLAEMTNLGIPVPPGFTISTEVCADYRKRKGKLAPSVRADVLTALASVERIRGRKFGDPEDPLLVSVRSGAPVSMPGMMDTILNLGLNDVTVEGLARQAGERFAFDSYRRFIQMYADVVLDVPLDRFEYRLEHAKRARGVELDTEFKGSDWRQIVEEYLELVMQGSGSPFPQVPADQLWGAIEAVFDSWGNARAIAYRALHGIDDALGTAVNVQSMVFGNMGEGCATGVAFTRNPSTGQNDFYGEYLENAQGEDVVAGVRTPQPINDASRTPETEGLPVLSEKMPDVYQELVKIYQRLEKHYQDMQDLEFTVEKDQLWLLQTRSGKRTTQAAVQIAVDMAKEGLITRKDAIMRVDASALDQLLHPTLDRSAPLEVLATGLPASPGAAVGRVVFSADEAEARARAGERVILVRAETSPEDILGMHAAQGVLTARGGMTSHAAVVARGMGKCCVAGCGVLAIDYAAQEMRVGEKVIRAGDWLTVDGSSGDVILGELPTVVPELPASFFELMKWSDRVRRLKIRTNADTPEDAEMARRFGAEGIGLCRTEHMFFDAERILAVREMILAHDGASREAALAKLLPMQRQDFKGIFRAMDGLPVTVRLLDPPLHEFLPHQDEEIVVVAEALGLSVAELRAKLESLHEFNPMLGHRGCRLGVTFPEIYRMQVQAITEAACEISAEGVKVRPEIMVPLVTHAGELSLLREEIKQSIAQVRSQYPDSRVRPQIGTMIEVPRAALTADVIAQHADFFSFGTNDLTQMGYALSRDDAGSFLPAYVEKGIIEDDPFVSIDEEGIGQLVQLGTERGRATRPRLKVGVCGEHGGDPQSIRFFARLGLDYVSCSPYRVPVSRLAAAQAVVEESKG